ncbi:hypothetical protein [uncultured Cetobacterium sp.]|uniref:hypothetical protein n=1 Tax=uncultured Cetobacterium sp. TaxID=527638 RepID=UPI0026075E68|nr:hypothetical protein [uncultured Cetobacterium sp.]
MKMEQERVMSVKDWIKVTIIMMIPFVNIIMWIKWLVSDKTNLNLKNFLISGLVMMVICFILWMLIFGTMIATSSY